MRLLLPKKCLWLSVFACLASAVAGRSAAPPAPPPPRGLIKVLKFTHTLAEGRPGVLFALAYSPDGKLLAAACADRAVRLVDVRTGEIRHTLRGHGEYLHAIAFSADGRWLASGCSQGDEFIRVWDVRMGKLVRSFKVRLSHMGSLAFTPDGRKVLVGDAYGQFLMCDVVRGKQVRV